MRKTALLILTSVLFVGLATAQQVSNVEYSADSYLETAEGVMKGPVYVKPGMERREYTEGGSEMVMILRRDKNLAWMLMPGDKMYMEFQIPEEGRNDDLGAYEIDSTIVGPETVNGVETTKGKIIMTSPDGTKLGGFMWTSREGIVVKLDAIAVEKKEKVRFTINLENLNIGEQDPALFEIPSDYTKMDMGGFGNMFSGNGDLEEETNEAVNQPQEKSKKKFGLKKILDAIQ